MLYIVCYMYMIIYISSKILLIDPAASLSGPELSLASSYLCDMRPFGKETKRAVQAQEGHSEAGRDTRT